jgi:hypothetical protein
MPTLTVYVSTSCAGCLCARDLVQSARALRPLRRIDVVDVDKAGDLPRAVVGTPTYVLGDRVLSLGNPLLEDLLMALDTGVAR